ncbi:MAG: TetR family transcriptional regulator, partial [Gammaproteobacteria bacterium]|nr:TetR family transcriptional regulator [Gemmatimonadota bacterium]NIU73757.1 TetR family transcriptional regulator [Gammaproteobacteria bacterium]
MNETGRGTPAALLGAATKLFAEHGYAGTSIRMITRAAGANLAAVTYHFGTKRELYGAVLERAFQPLAEA